MLRMVLFTDVASLIMIDSLVSFLLLSTLRNY